MNGIVVISFDGELCRFNFGFIVNNELVYRGYLQRSQYGRVKNTVYGYISNPDGTQAREITKEYDYNTYWTAAEKYDKNCIAELIGHEIINYINI